LKKLIIMRHAEAPHNSSMFDDFNRQLSNNGVKQAEQSACHLIKNDIKIDKILSSPSLRTKQTLEIMQNNGIDAEVEFYNEIYRTSEEAMMEIIKIQQEVKNLLILGHNPTISYLYFSIINDYNLNHFSPGSFAMINYQKDRTWSNIFYNKPTSTTIFIPEGIK
jgi:phosphohistidine phosphatase